LECLPLVKQKDDVKTNFVNDPDGYANCLKAVTTGVSDGAGDFFNDPTIPQAGQKASTAIDLCINQYNVDLDLTKFNICMDNASNIVIASIITSTAGKCWIPIGTSCILSEKTGKILLFGGAIVLGLIYIPPLLSSKK
jgi:hypothetical protein